MEADQQLRSYLNRKADATSVTTLQQSQSIFLSEMEKRLKTLDMAVRRNEQNLLLLR